jgi:hypothetical protein
LFSVAYRGGTHIWVAGRGGAIIRRVDPIATVSLPIPRLPPLLRGGTAKAQLEKEKPADDGDIPKAEPPVLKKPIRP